MNDIFPKFNVEIILSNLSKNGIVGQYLLNPDIILLDREATRSFPITNKIILLHEMFHSTLSNKRTLRIERLRSYFGSFIQGSLSYRVEECIAEICTMIACKKLGILNQYSSIVIEKGIEENYNSDIYIPWMEVVSALNYFSSDDVDFSKELDEVKKYLVLKYGMNITRSYV